MSSQEDEVQHASCFHAISGAWARLLLARHANDAQDLVQPYHAVIEEAGAQNRVRVAEGRYPFAPHRL
jgi:7-keto-8-aminopelargonate synthetase-like enzyme